MSLFNRLSSPLATQRGSVRPQLPNRFEPALDQRDLPQQLISVESHEEREAPPAGVPSAPRPTRVATLPRPVVRHAARPEDPPIAASARAPAPAPARVERERGEAPKNQSFVEPIAARPAPAPSDRATPIQTQGPRGEQRHASANEPPPRVPEVAASSAAQPPRSQVSEPPQRIVIERSEEVQAVADTPIIERSERRTVAPPLDGSRHVAALREAVSEHAAHSPAVRVGGEPIFKAESAAALPSSTVRIHIGRVEVRAVTAAPAAPPVRAAKSNLPSLEDYLSPSRERQR